MAERRTGGPSGIIEHVYFDLALCFGGDADGTGAAGGASKAGATGAASPSVIRAAAASSSAVAPSEAAGDVGGRSDGGDARTPASDSTLPVADAGSS